ncbi:MAG: DoxX family protein [Anaerolineae bacterium]|nr:DoxX family protein [Anaerolineae bacterium]MDQ7035467.1 DoxX family protein [Anaerolineae bacterium]
MEANILFFLGRMIYGVMLIFLGMNHFMNHEYLSNSAKAQGIPFAQAGVIISGLVLIVGALSILFGIFTLYGVLLLVLFFLPVTFLMHRFWVIQDPTLQMVEMMHFMKNFVIMGAALMFLAVHNWSFALSSSG